MPRPISSLGWRWPRTLFGRARDQFRESRGLDGHIFLADGTGGAGPAHPLQLGTVGLEGLDQRLDGPGRYQPAVPARRTSAMVLMALSPSLTALVIRRSKELRTLPGCPRILGDTFTTEPNHECVAQMSQHPPG